MKFLRRAQGENAQATFEMFLVFPLFLFLLLFMVDLGIWMYASVSVANGTRDAVRYGSVKCGGAPSCDSDLVWVRLRDRSGNMLDDADWALGAGEITIDWVDRGNGGASTADKGDSVVVKVDHSHPMIFFPFSLPVKACADMRIEQNNTDATGDVGTSEC